MEAESAKNTSPEKFYFTPKMAERILLSMKGNEDTVEASLDINKSNINLVLQDNYLILPINERIERSVLERIAKTKKIYVYHQGALLPVEIMNDNYYKLVSTDGAPTLEISGIQMHRTKNCEPFLDAWQKVSEVVRRGDVVLDTCGGLGYTAIWSRRFGARRVISVEIDEKVRAIRQDNPWSSEMFNDSGIELVDDDVFVYINSVSCKFDSIIHDPPRFSLAGGLYGREFYSHLYRIMKPGGRVFHYTGNPYSKGKKRDFIGGVRRRLREVGFATFLRPEKMGVMGIKND
ncbi:SAM-dependent methyltransferase [candidate division NPL-UPA2 bacterium]|nr:SAM-dependent methyltransferase [candidate division NPL-UPA2 bacterium]